MKECSFFSAENVLCLGSCMGKKDSKSHTEDTGSYSAGKWSEKRDRVGIGKIDRRK